MATNAARATVALHIAEGRKAFKRQVWRGEPCKISAEWLRKAWEMQQSAIHQRNKKYIYYSCTSRQKNCYVYIPRTTVVIFNRSRLKLQRPPCGVQPAPCLSTQDQGHCSATTRRIAPHQQWSRTLRAVHVQICLCQPVRQLRVSLLGSPSEKRNLFQ